MEDRSSFLSAISKSAYSRKRKKKKSMKKMVADDGAYYDMKMKDRKKDISNYPSQGSSNYMSRSSGYKSYSTKKSKKSNY